MGNKQGEENSENAVIYSYFSADYSFTVLTEALKGYKRNYCKSKNSGAYIFILTVTFAVFFEVKEGTAGDNRKRKGKKYVKVKSRAGFCNKALGDIYCLTDKTEQENTKKVFCFVFCVKTAFTYKKGKDRHSDSAYKPQCSNFRQKHIAYMVNEHGYAGD